MKILAFAGSNSSTSINKALVTYTASFFKETEILDLNDYETAILSIDRKNESGIPQKILDFSEKINGVDGIILSLAEHNGAYSAAFKNIFDWLSLIPGKTVFMEKPILLMAASPGKRGGKSVLEIAEKRFPFNGGKVVTSFSFPAFNDNFDTDEGKITHETLDQELKKKIEEFKAFLNNN
ncbi:MAG TPA: NAD(P)H-dependent oxidoreductase [Saprospiraceae bacterium]|nr:NAD(P)H-dependent oxidoreductase [Saprospiraceae bacterium]